MLKGLPKLLSPALLKILCEMGHGDEIVIADGNFPAENYGKRVVRADGCGGVEMLDAVLRLMRSEGFGDLELYEDTQGIPRVIGGTLYTEI